MSTTVENTQTNMSTDNCIKSIFYVSKYMVGQDEYTNQYIKILKNI